jgi:diguanylate cyclase (GGDEF)-like protein
MQLTTATDHKRRERDSSLLRDFIVAAAIAALMAWICWLDLVTGSAPVQHLYYLPVMIAAIRFGVWPGIAASLVAIVLYHVGGELRQASYSEADLIKMALLVAVGVIAARLADDKKRFRHLAMTDDLTGLANLRHFESRLAEMISDARKSGAPLSMVIVDLDRLKQLNDQHGHMAGAEAVRTVGHLIGGMVPEAALACRYGGDEFAIALPGCNATEAARWADGLRGAVHAATPCLLGRSWPEGTLSISAGAACIHPASADWAVSPEKQGETLFRAADLAMYEAKSAGRNRTAASRQGSSQAECEIWP